MKRFFRFVSLLTICIFLALFLSCCLDYSPQQSGSSMKNYNYYFKVYVPERYVRTMNEEKIAEINNKIFQLGQFFEKQCGRRFRSSEDPIIKTAIVAATVFISEEVRNKTIELANEGAFVMFSYKEMLIDNSELDIEQKMVSSEEFKLFVYDGSNDPFDKRAWKEEKINHTIPSSLRHESDVYNSSEISSAPNIHFNAKNAELVQNFFNSMVDLISADSRVDIDNITEDISILKTKSSEMIVEFEDISAEENNRGWKKKIKKVTSKVITTIEQKYDFKLDFTDRNSWIYLGVTVAAATIIIIAPQIAPGLFLIGKVGSTVYIGVAFLF